MNKFKIITIVGTRPELIKLSCIVKKLDKFTNHILVHTGQNYDYELNQIKKITLSQFRKRNHIQKIQSKNMLHVEYIILNRLRYLNFLQRNY